MIGRPIMTFSGWRPLLQSLGLTQVDGIYVLFGTTAYTDQHDRYGARHYQLVRYESTGQWMLYRVRRPDQWNAMGVDRYEIAPPGVRLLRLDPDSPYRPSVGATFARSVDTVCDQAHQLISDDHMGGICALAAPSSWEYLKRHGLGPLAGFPDESNSANPRITAVPPFESGGGDRSLPEWISPDPSYHATLPARTDSDGFPSWDELERRYQQEYRAQAENDPVETINPVIDRDGEPFGTLPEQPTANADGADSAPKVVAPEAEADLPIVWEIHSNERTLARLQRDPRLRRCQCGSLECDEVTRRVFAPGHDAKMISNLLRLIRSDQLDQEQAARVIVHVGGSAALVDKFRRAYWRLYHSNFTVRLQADGGRSAYGTGRPEVAGLIWRQVSDTALFTEQTSRSGMPRGVISYEVVHESGRRAWKLQYRSTSDSGWVTMPEEHQTAEQAVAWDAANGNRARYYANR